MALYNELLKRYPWYVGVLYNRFNYDWRSEQPKGRPPIYRWPVFEYYEGKLSCRYSRRMIEFAQKTTGVVRKRRIQLAGSGAGRVTRKMLSPSGE